MKRHECLLRFAGILVVTAVCLAAFPASAATGTAMKVPFAFEAGGKALPAGEYRVEAMGAAGNYKLLDAQGRAVMFLPGTPVRRKAGAAPGAMFYRGEGKSVLAGVTLPDGSGLMTEVRIFHSGR